MSILIFHCLFLYFSVYTYISLLILIFHCLYLYFIVYTFISLKYSALHYMLSKANKWMENNSIRYITYFKKCFTNIQLSSWRLCSQHYYDSLLCGLILLQLIHNLPRLKRIRNRPFCHIQLFIYMIKCMCNILKEISLASYFGCISR